MRSASSTGTALAVRMLRVRVKRAVLKPRATRPTIGSLAAATSARAGGCPRVAAAAGRTGHAATDGQHEHDAPVLEVADRDQDARQSGSCWPVVSNTSTTFGTT